jgi:iron(III) transport system substrate-binding protein
VKSAAIDNSALAGMGSFKPDTLNVSALGRNQPEAQKVYDRAGWR